MKSRKSEKANIESLKGVFILSGLVVSLAMTYVAFEWKTYEGGVMDLGQLDVNIEDEIIPITQRQNTPPPPPPPAAPEVIQIVDDEVEIEEIEFESTETDESTEIQLIEEVGEETDEVLNFVNVENKPVYPGCEKESTEDDKFRCFQLQIAKFVAKEFQFPEMARQMGIQGKVWVSFVIEKDGSVSGIKVERGVDKLLDEEAIRVVKKLPKFIPAKVGGRSVRMSYSLPINAKLQ